MTPGGPASSDPYPATPRPFAVRKGDPSAPVPSRRAGPALVGTAFGVLLVVVARVVPSGPPLWQALLPPLVLLAVQLVLTRVRLASVRRAMDASEAALHAGATPLPVRLVPTWGGTWQKPANRFAVHGSADGRLLGYASMVIEPSRFDPRDQLWLHGRPEAGAPIAFQAHDDRPPMLTSRGFLPVGALEAMDAHPRSAVVNRLLGWEGARPVEPPVASGGIPLGDRDDGLPPALVEPATRAGRRLRRSALALVAAPVGLVPVAAALHLGLVASASASVATWAAAALWARRGAVAWVSRPVADALRRVEGLDADDARYVAAALATMRFGLPPSAVDGSTPDAAPPMCPPDPLPAGWGRTPQPYS